MKPIVFGPFILRGSSPLTKWLGSPPFISHEVRPFGSGVPRCPILRGRKRSPWLLTTYPSPVKILQAGGPMSLGAPRCEATEETSSRSLRSKKHGLRWKRKRPRRAESGEGAEERKKRQGNHWVWWSANGFLWTGGVGIRNSYIFHAKMIRNAKHCLGWVIHIFLQLKSIPVQVK